MKVAQRKSMLAELMSFRGRLISGALKGDSVAAHTVWMIGGQGLRVALQAAYFVIIARVLRPDGYGAFVAASAITAIVSPFAGWGSGHLLIRELAAAPERFRAAWGSTLRVTFLSAAGLCVVVIGVGRLILPAS